MLNRFCIYFLVFISLSSCRKEKTQTIPNEFSAFVDTFFEEANMRNRDIALSDFNFRIKFADLEDKAGTCNFNNNEIQIDETSWSRYNHQQKELLLFHELGHCLLDRRHKEDKTDSGECISFMSPNDMDCSKNLYSDLWRKYYLDELFNETQDLPLWYQESKIYNNFDDTNRTDIIDTTITSAYYQNAIPFSFENNFVMEIVFNEWIHKTNSVSIGWDNNYFSYCKNCTVSNLSIRVDQRNVFNYTFEEAEGIESTKLTIEKIDNQYRFFYNQEFVHTFEFTEWNNNSFGTTIWPEIFGDEITMDIKVYFL